MGYETKFLRFLEGIVDDMERKIKKQHERLEHDERYMKAVSRIMGIYLPLYMLSLCTKHHHIIHYSDL